MSRETILRNEAWASVPRRRGSSDESVARGAFQKKKPYGTIKIAEFLEWFLGFAREFHRLLRDDGSLVIDIGGVWNKGTPTKSLYQHHLLIALCDQLGFHYAQDFYWYNPGALPAPAEWVNVRRIRVKSAVNLVWWLSKSPWPKANNRHVLRKYSGDMLRLLQRGYRTKERPSGHNITPKFNKNHGGAIPPNLLDFGNNDSNGEYLKRCLEAKLPVHPARFPRGLPEFFIKFCSEDLLSRRRQGVAQMLLGTLAEKRFEDITAGIVGGKVLRIEDHRPSRSDTDYRLLNGNGNPICRLNIKFHGTLFRGSKQYVDLDPVDCFALATYKIHIALKRQELELGRSPPTKLCCKAAKDSRHQVSSAACIRPVRQKRSAYRGPSSE